MAFGATPNKDATEPAAANKKKGAGQILRLMDTDGDGKISPAEYKAWRYRIAYRNFAAEDANRDGKIDFNEYIAHLSHKERARFYWLDTNNKGFSSDGLIDRAEAGFHTKRFDKMDVNHDGKIDWTEWNNFWLAGAKDRFAKLDTNGDGVLGFAEANPKLDEKIAEKFKEYDTNNDGFISEEEFVAAAVRIAKEHAEHEFHEIDEE